MIINADSLLPHLKEKMRPTKSDDSRHLLCPGCGVRTKLNTLGDGRRKCTVCGKKFRVHKMTDGNKLRQCAEILLCFNIDFPAHRAAEITQHRYRLVAEYYDHFRRLIAEKSPPPEKGESARDYEKAAEAPREKSWCVWCGSKARTAAAGGKTPPFSVRFRENGEVSLDPLEGVSASRRGLAGLVCCGKFHRSAEGVEAKQGPEELWAWLRERVRTHHAVWKQNGHLYLKELEWKYNNRSLALDLQARKFIGLMPMDFLTSWSSKTEKGE